MPSLKDMQYVLKVDSLSIRGEGKNGSRGREIDRNGLTLVNVFLAIRFSLSLPIAQPQRDIET
jgi:hypothetical protein